MPLWKKGGPPGPLPVFESWVFRMSEPLRYYSTNRHLDGVPGITPFRETVPFREALLMGQAPDEGLFMPETIPCLPADTLESLKGAAYTEAALLVVKAFLA